MANHTKSSLLGLSLLVLPRVASERAWVGIRSWNQVPLINNSDKKKKSKEERIMVTIGLGSFCGFKLPYPLLLSEATENRTAYMVGWVVHCTRALGPRR